MDTTTNLINVKPLHYWTYKVLPLVYDDSLSYLEILSKAVYKLNQLIANNNQLPELIKEAIAGGGYLDNLQEQIAGLNDKDSKTATADRYAGQLIWLKGDLYRITRNMLAGDQYIESSTGVTGNIEKLTFEEWCNRYREYLKEAISENNEGYNILANKAYSTGDWLWWKGQMYRATTEIVKNANLSTDINLELVNIEQIIKNLQSRLTDDELYPIYYKSRENMTFKGSIGAGEIVEAKKANTHIYDQVNETMSIV